MTLNLIA